MPQYAIEFCIAIRGLAVCSVDAFVVHIHHADPPRSHKREQNRCGFGSIGVLPSRHTPKSHEDHFEGSIGCLSQRDKPEATASKSGIFSMFSTAAIATKEESFDIEAVVAELIIFE